MKVLLVLGEGVKKESGNSIGGEIGKIVMVPKDVKDLIKWYLFEIHNFGEHVVNSFATDGS